MKLCQKYKIHLIVDEIYTFSMYSVPQDKPSTPFKSILSFDINLYIDKDYLHFLYGFSKDLAASGLRLGCIWTKNEQLHSAMSGQGFFNWPSNLCEAIGVSMLENHSWLEDFIKTNQRRLGEQSAFTRSLLDEHGIPYYKEATAGFFIWLDLRKFIVKDIDSITWEHERAFKQLFKKHRVYITSGESMSSEKPGFFRLCYVRDDAYLKEGFKRITAALEEAKAIDFTKDITNDKVV